MPLFPACTTGNTMLIGIDAHSTAIPPVPLNPHPFIGVLMLWTSPKFPMTNVMIAGSPACCSGAKGYSVHIPQGTWVDIPKVTFKVWYITNLITVAFATIFTLVASIMIATVKGLATAALSKSELSASKQVWDGICGVFQPYTQWQTWAQMLIPPMPLPIAEGNVAIGSPTVSVSGGSMALGIPLGGASCSEIPIVPNACVLAFSHVMVGMTFAQLAEAFATNAILGAAGELGKRTAGRFIARNRCRLGLEPIDLVTGSNFEDKTDFELNGPLALTWKRYYASTLETDGPMGWNWSHEYQRWLEFQGDSTVYHNQENRSIVFPALGNDGDSHFLPFDRFTLTRVSAAEYTVKGTDGMIAFFTRPPKSDRAWIRRFEDRAGEVLGFRYDPKGRLHEIVHSTGQRLKVDTQADGRITRLSLTGNDGRLRMLVGYEYDGHGDLMIVTDAAGKRAKCFYDDKHQMIRKTDRNGYSFHYVYDRNGRCIKSRGDDDLYAGEIEYIPAANTTIMTAPSGGKYIHSYDKRGLITSILDPYGGVQVFEYDDAGNKVAEIDENGHTTKYKYDSSGHVVEETNPFGGTTKRTYNDLGLKVEATDPDGNTSQWKYDERGNLLAEIEPSGATTRHEYDARNRRTKTIDPQGIARCYERDTAGILTAKTTEGGARLEGYRYDEYGRRIAVVHGASETSYRLDALGRVLEIHNPDGSSEANTFDAEGNILSFRDREGRAWYYKYSSWNKLVEMIDPLGGVTRYKYSRADELVSVIDPNGHETTYERDQKDRIVGINRGGAPVKRLIYDPGRNVTERHDAQGHVLVRRAYGPGGLKTASESNGDGPAEYAYDQCGRLVKAANRHAEIQRRFDSNGRLLEDARRDGKTAYKFDPMGRLVGIELSEGLSCELNYDEGEDIVSFRDPCGGTHMVWRHDDWTYAHEYPNGLVEHKDVSDDGRLTAHTLEVNADPEQGRRLLDRVFQYDRVGNLIRREDRLAHGARQFRYDGCNRLVEMAELGRGIRRFLHDRGNNLAFEADQTTLFGPHNCLTQVGDTRFAYDSLGRLIEKGTGASVTRYAYNSEDQLIRVEMPDGTAVTFGYDATGCRAWKEIAGRRTWYQWTEHRLHREIFSDDHRRVYLYLSPEDDAPFMFLDLRREPGGQWKQTSYYLHTDDLGLPQAVTSAEGDVVWSMEMQPFGEATIEDPHGLHLQLRYPGRYHDPETGLDYNGRRYYDPTIGRFIQPDPIGLAGGLNLYAGPSNPLRDLDRMGTASDCSSQKPPASGDEEGEPSTDAQEAAPARKRSRRDEYMGATLDRNSPGGQEVVNGTPFILAEDGTTRLYQFTNPDTGEISHHPLSEMDMGHIRGASEYWNEDGGRFQGPRSPEVRRFMTDPTNYELQPRSYNRSRGATAPEYLPPANQ